VQAGYNLQRDIKKVEHLDTQFRNVEKRYDTIQIFANAHLLLLENQIRDLVIFNSRQV